jgi:triphosphoribosyl-dephospho-CoA synthase
MTGYHPMPRPAAPAHPSSRPPTSIAIEVAADLARLPSSCPPWGRGWCATAACLFEAAVPKPGNVHPAAEFSDLTHAELVAAALAIGPPLEQAVGRPLGRTILAAVEASRGVTRSNANLGIVLAMAPLAAVDGDQPPTSPGVARVLAGLQPSDAVAVWEAIALARPGGLGRVARHDVAGPPPADLLDAMRSAAPRDAIAELWAESYETLLEGLVADLRRDLTCGLGIEASIVRGFLRQLARRPDSLIARRHGPAVAADVSARAAAALAASEDRWQAASVALDEHLRAPVRINPGTTADLVAAALYILLRDPVLRPHWGLSWSSRPPRRHDHP